MGRLIDFKTRAVAVETPEPQPDAPLPVNRQLDTFKKLYDRSAADINTLVDFYKATGQWNETAERLMARAVENIKAVCAAIAGEEKHG
jgi:hypothetical protein